MEWEEKIKGIAERVVSRAEILPLLNVLVRNPGLSSWNLLMVYSQNPSARYVCGRKAWEAAGRYVKVFSICLRSQGRAAWVHLLIFKT